MWLALEIALIWTALSILTGILYGVVVAGGWRPYWRSIRQIWREDIAGWDVGEHGDLSEGR